MTPLDDSIKRLLLSHAVSVERLTEDQLVVALKQAIMSGDFERQVVLDEAGFEKAQSVTYEPLRRVRELQAQLGAVTAALEDLQAHHQRLLDKERLRSKFDDESG